MPAVVKKRLADSNQSIYHTFVPVKEDCQGTGIEHRHKAFESIILRKTFEEVHSGCRWRSGGGCQYRCSQQGQEYLKMTQQLILSLWAPRLNR